MARRLIESGVSFVEVTLGSLSENTFGWDTHLNNFPAVKNLSGELDAGWGTLLVAGLLVGIGTRYGAGCTSGHGVCGLSRLSLRSLVATAVFMVAGMATVAVMRHLI